MPIFLSRFPLSAFQQKNERKAFLKHKSSIATNAIQKRWHNHADDGIMIRMKNFVMSLSRQPYACACSQSEKRNS